MISLKFSSMPELGAGVGPSPVTRLLREPKERGGSKRGGSLGSVKEGGSGNRKPTITYFTDLPGNFMIWLIVLFLKSVFLKRKQKIMGFKLNTTFSWCLVIHVKFLLI